MAGVEPLSFTDIFAWSLLVAQPIAAHETRLILELDNIFTHEVAKKRDADSKAKAKRKR